MSMNDMKNLTKGQIHLTLPLAMMGISFVAAPIVAYYSGQAATREEIAHISERTARLETSVPAMQQDIRDIKTSLQGIERALRISSPVLNSQAKILP